MADNALRDKFTYHPPTPEAARRHTALSEAFITIAALCSDLVPAGREQALVLTKLEEAKMWASAGVARGQDSL